ncbi:MAG: sensor histidine kinase [Prevotella sp.]
MMKKITSLFWCKWMAVALLALGAVNVHAESALQEEVPQEIKDRYRQLLQQAFSSDATAAIDSFLQQAKVGNDWRIVYLGSHLKFYNLTAQDSLGKAVELGAAARELAWKHRHMESYFDMWAMMVAAYSQHNKNYQALLEARKMSEKAVEVESPYGMMISNFYLGQVFSYRNEPQLAIGFFGKAVDGMKKLNETDNLYLAYIFMAQCYRNMMKDQLVIQYLKQAEKEANNDIQRFNVEYAGLPLSFDVVPTAEYLRRYDQLKKNPLFAQLSDQTTRHLLKVMDLLVRKEPARALPLIGGIEDKGERYEMLIRAYRQLGRYEDAFRIADSLKIYNDSLRSKLQLDELAAIQSSMDNAEMKIKMERQSFRGRLAVVLMLMGFLLVVTALLIYIAYRRRRIQIVLTEKNRELEEAHGQLEKALQMKVAFINNMSHEIRTPLNQISGFAQVLSMPDLPAEDQRQGRKIIEEQTEHLVDMLDNVIEISDLESNPKPLLPKPIQLHEFISHLGGTIHHPQEGVELRLATSTDESLTVEADESSLRRIVLLLVDNAVRFTSEGYVAVDARRTLVGGEPHVELTVEDTGCGIPADLHERVFERFFKADEFVPGTGLGLSIARLHAHRLGAKLYVSPDYQAGCRMVLTF